MAKTEIAKASDTAVFRPQDIFSTMRHEMDRMFERFEHGFPRCPHLFHAESGTIIVPELDVRDNLHVHHHRGRAAGRRRGAGRRAPRGQRPRARERGLAPGRDRDRRRRGSPSATTGPAILIALDGEEGSGSGRSIPAFDLLGGLHASAGHLLRYGGHKAAAGLTIARGGGRRLPRGVPRARRRGAARRGPASRGPDRRRRPGRRAVARPRRGAPAARPVRHGQPGRLAARPRRADDRPAARSARAATSPSRSSAGGARSRCVLFGAGDSLPVERGRARRRRRPPGDRPLERRRLAEARPAPAPHLRPQRAIDVLGEPEFADGLRARARPRPGGVARARGAARRRTAPRPARHRHRRPARRPRRSGEPVLAVTAHAPHRARALRDRVGGFALTSWAGAGGRSRRWPRRSPTSSPSTRPHGRCSTIRPGRAGPTWRGVRLN